MVFRRDRGWRCGCCDGVHTGLVMVFGPNEPLPWMQASTEGRADGFCDRDFCSVRVDGVRQFFVRGEIEIPVIGHPNEVFKWMVWTSLSEESARLVTDHWSDPARADLEPRFGWLVSALPYPVETLGLPTMVHQRPPGMVPLVELDHSMDHPLVQHQHAGIAMDEIVALNDAILGGQR